MSEKRYSVMVLPRRDDGGILLQSWTNERGTITDGFGSFYQEGESPGQTAQRVLAEDLNVHVPVDEVARLQYFMDKPTGMVDLQVTVYFAVVTADTPLPEAAGWFMPSDVPYAQMHPATAKWLPMLLDGQVPLKATIKVNQQGDHTTGKLTEFTSNP